MIKNYVIGFGYKKSSGKTTAAEYINNLDLDNVRTCKTMFAHRLKMIAEEAFGLNGKKDEKGRRLLQEIGSTARHYRPDFWVHFLFCDVIGFCDNEAAFLESGGNFIMLIDDVRYENEIERLRRLEEEGYVDKTIIIRTDRDTNFVDSHSSEHGLDNYNEWDYVIDNNGTMEELYIKINEILTDLGIKEEE